MVLSRHNVNENIWHFRVLVRTFSLQKQVTSSSSTMKLITSANSISGLKILLAAEFENVPLEIELTSCSDRSYLIVNEDCKLFSANAAVWYLSSLAGKKSKPHLDDWIDWEATSLAPQVQALIAKNPNKLSEILTHLDKSLKNKFILGVSFWYFIIIYTLV